MRKAINKTNHTEEQYSRTCTIRKKTIRKKRNEKETKREQEYTEKIRNMGNRCRGLRQKKNETGKMSRIVRKKNN